MLAYVKGQGWVEESSVKNTRILEWNGKEYAVWFEIRFPNPGEYGWNRANLRETEDNTFKSLEAHAFKYNSDGKFGWLAVEDGPYHRRSEDYPCCVTVFTEDFV